MTIKKIAVAAVLASGLTICGGASALGQTKLGPSAPVTYDNKYEIYGGLNYMNFMAGPVLPRRMSFGGGEIEGTWWVAPKWGASAEFRGEAGTTQVYPNAQVYGIHHPLVYTNAILFGAQYRWMQNQHAALVVHAYGGPSFGVFDAGTAGAGVGAIGTTPASNANIVGLFANHTAPIFALGAGIDMNRSKNWAIRLSPDLILDEFGSGTREYFAISGGVIYRFPLRKKK